MYDKVEVHVTCYNNLVFVQSVPSLHWHADILSTPTHFMPNPSNPPKALRDVELDWYKVLGYRAVIYGNNSWNPAQSRATATTPAVFFGDVTTEEVSGKKKNSSLHLVSDDIGSPYNPYCFNIYLRGIYIYIYMLTCVRSNMLTSPYCEAWMESAFGLSKLGCNLSKGN